MIRSFQHRRSWTAEDLIAEGDGVACRYTMRGADKGEMTGIAPIGKQITVTGMEFRRIVDGKLTGHWESFDQMGMMQQLGVMPAEGQG